MNIKNIIFSLLIFFAINSYANDILLNKKDVKKDVSYLIKILENVHPNCYKEINKEVFRNKLDSLTENIDYPITDLLFSIKLIPIFNLIKDGHSQMQMPLNTITRNNLNYFPFLIKKISDRYFIINDYKAFKLSKKEIISINEIPISELVNNLSRYVNGETIDFKKEAIIRDHQYLNILFNILYPKWKGYNLIVNDNGNKLKYFIDGVFEEFQDKSFNNEKKYRFYKTDLKTGILIINEFTFGRKMRQDIDTIFLKIKNSGINNLVIDLRNCRGGNSYNGGYILKYIIDTTFCQLDKSYVNNTKLAKKTKKKQFPFYMKVFPFSMIYHYDIDTNKFIINSKRNSSEEPFSEEKRFKGKVYVLISNFTYSSAISFSRTLYDYRKAVFVGNETVWASSFGPAIAFKLPKSKLSFTVSFIHQIRPSGIINNKGIIPDYIITENVECWQKNDDNQIKYILRELIKK